MLGGFGIVLYLLFLWINLQKYNQAPLDVKTFEGTNSPYHPDVVWFSKKWGGWNYWMVETPYSPKTKPYRDRYECPSVHVSNDGINWQEQNGHINPIDSLLNDEVLNFDYMSDPCLVLVNDTLECWYRFTHRSGDVSDHSVVSLCRKKTIDGLSWSDREVIEGIDKYGFNDKILMCPSVLYKDNRYFLYFVDLKSEDKYIYLIKSEDAKTWTSPERCRFNDCILNVWHIDVSYIDNKYYLVCYEYGGDIALLSSSDGVNFYYLKNLLSPSNTVGSFYSNGLYQACLIKDSKYKLYFSADNKEQTFIGLMEGFDVDKMEVVSVNNLEYSSFCGMLCCKWRMETRRICFIIRNIINL